MFALEQRRSVIEGAVVVGLFLAIAVNCANGLTRDEKAAIDSWLMQAKHHAMRVADANGQFEVWLPIGKFHARRGSFPQVCEAVSRISDNRLRNACLQSIATAAARFDDQTSAVRIVKLIDNPQWRNGGLAAISSVLSSRHDFVGAAETIELVDSPPLQQDLWYGLAREQARLGYHDSALKTARKFLGAGFGGEKDKADLLKFIAEAKRTGVRKKPTEFRTGIYDGLRRLGRKRWTPDAEELAALKQRVRYGGKPANVASAWYWIARVYHHQGGACSPAIRKAAQVAPTIPDPYDRLLYSMPIAHLLLERGDTQQARQLAQKVLTREGVLAAFRRRDEFGIAPAVVVVLVQLGDVDEAFQTAALANVPCDGETWWALGACCALEGNTAEVNKRLQPLESEKCKALLCIGVAAGLQELSDRAGQGKE